VVEPGRDEPDLVIGLMADSPIARALLITGTVGAGKTSVAVAVGEIRARARIPHAVIDLDWLRRCWPPPSADRFHHALLLSNLRAVARNDLDVGARWLVLAGVVESRTARQHYQDAVGVDLVVCRLTVDAETLRERLVERHADDQRGLRWHLDRAGELDDILQRAQVEDVTVPVAELSVSEVAAAVLDAVSRSPGGGPDR
jgi:adenylylsulfate kinase